MNTEQWTIYCTKLYLTVRWANAVKVGKNLHTRRLDYNWFYSLKRTGSFLFRKSGGFLLVPTTQIYCLTGAILSETHITNIYLNNTTWSSTMLYIQALHGQLLLCGWLLRWLLWDSYEEGTGGKRPTCSLIWSNCKLHFLSSVGKNVWGQYFARFFIKQIFVQKRVNYGVFF